MSTLTLSSKPLTDDRRAVLHRRIRWIVAGTITYNVIEAAIALAAGTVASSSALIGFGLDSIVEVLSAAAVAWQFATPDPHRREKVALRLIAFSFFGLAAFITVDAVRTLFGTGRGSVGGLALRTCELPPVPVVQSGLTRRLEGHHV